MKAAEIIAARTVEWKALETDINWFRNNLRIRDADRVAQFASRYRAACGDLSLAISMQFPAETIHTQLYRSETFRLSRWGARIVFDVPQRIFRDPCTWISFVVFWGLFLGSLLAAYSNDEFANSIAGETQLKHIEVMYSQPMNSGLFDETRGAMTGFYV
ncbi:MAG: hypothetical protein FJ267_10350, partial [Planctomycetes bacterium]|nr:hypothetical protein [Planctomycetota bacterium]